MVMIEQQGKNCLVELGGKAKILKNCNAIKLANSLFNKPFGQKYSPKEMWKFGFGRKSITTL